MHTINISLPLLASPYLPREYRRLSFRQNHILVSNSKRVNAVPSELATAGGTIGMRAPCGVLFGAMWSQCTRKCPMFRENRYKYVDERPIITEIGPFLKKTKVRLKSWLADAKYT